MLATLCMLQPLLRDLRQLSTKCFLKPAVVLVLFLFREDVTVSATALPIFDWVVQGVISSCSGCIVGPCNAEQLGYSNITCFYTDTV